MSNAQNKIKHARISLILADSEGKEKHVAVDIADADKIVKTGVSDEAGTMLSVLEKIAGKSDDGGKVFITPESEKDSKEPTYLLRGKKQVDPPPPAAA